MLDSLLRDTARSVSIHVIIMWFPSNDDVE